MRMNLPGEESGKKVNRYKGLEGLLSTKRNENGKDASGGGSLLEKGRGFDLKGAIKAAEKAVVAAPQLVHQEGQDQGEGERGGRTGEKHERASSSTSLQGSKRLKRIHSLPMDWSLKKRVHFESSTPFECFMNSFNLAPDLNHQAMRSFTSGNRRSRDANQMFLQSLYTWIFPLNSFELSSKFSLTMAASEGNARGSSNTEAANMDANRDQERLDNFRILQQQRMMRFKMFREGLRDLVYSLYAGLCSAFYVIPPPGSSDSFTCLFQGRDIDGGRGVRATLSGASDGMIELLREEFGLEPVVCGLGERGKRIADKLKMAGGDGHKVLLFLGREQVHGLFDFLITTCGKTYHKQRDVPTLLAPVPFEGSSVKRYAGVYRKNTLLKHKHERGLQTFTLTFQDDGGLFLPPWVVDRLCTTFRKTQSSFSMTSDSGVDFKTTSLQCGGGEDGNNNEDVNERGEERSEYGGGFWDTEECDKWQERGGNIANLQCEKGVFVI
mmetsp:Transcript_12186/g.33801  ORF Transcript_12186/g.33801 Transcript_12186/m.33801 type:complete len:496 (+) Transcript_12186:305-1792(+)